MQPEEEEPKAQPATDAPATADVAETEAKAAEQKPPTPWTGKTPQASHPSKAPHAPQAPQAPQTAQAPRGSQAPQAPQAPQAKQRRRKIERRYLPSVDGLRALAVIAVLAYHLNLPWAPGGLVGVTVFFVISGFLITGILCVELAESNKIDLKRFWIRRVRRLFPAIALVVVVTALTAFFLNKGLLYKLKTDLLPALFWFTNWWYIFREQSYFEAIAQPSPVLHFWSLSIEEQFYLVWPLVMLGLYRLGINHRGIRRFCLVLAGTSALGMIVMYDPAGDPSRVYYGTDTRAFSLLIGAWLALIWPVYTKRSRVDPARMSDDQRKKLSYAGLAGLGVLAVLCIFVPGTNAFWYRGGLVLASFATAMVIAAITLPGSALCRAFSAKPLVWLGTRSYGIYLWHYPLMLLMNPSNEGTPGVGKIVLELALIVAISELSFRFVEDPLRHGALGKTYRAWKAGEITGPRLQRTRIVAATCLVFIAGAGLSLALAQNTNQGLLTDADIAGGVSDGTIVDTGSADTGSADSKGSGSDSDSDSSSNSADADSKDSKSKDDDKEVEVTGYEPLMIGDSVSIGLTDLFHEAYPGGLIDACGNRQIAMGQTVYDYYRDRGEVGTNVIIALGTNGSFDSEQLEALVADIGEDRTIWIITNRVPASWQRTTNQTINEVAANHKNVNVIDWEAYSSGHDDWVGGDGIHLTQDGRRAYIQMIQEAIGSNKMIEAATKKANEEAGGAWTAPTDGSVSQEMHDALMLGMTPAARISRETTGEAAP